MTRLGQLTTALLSLPLRLLDLSGAAVGADLVHALLQAQLHPALQQPSPPTLEGLTLRGLRLGDVDWTLLAQRGRTPGIGAAFGSAAEGGLGIGIGIGFSGNSICGQNGGNSLSPFGAALRSAAECAWRPQCDPVGQLAPLSGLIRLSLVDCTDHGCLLPYLHLLPRLGSLRLLASRHQGFRL